MTKYEIRDAYAAFLIKTLPIQNLVHLTHPGQSITQQEHDGCFSAFMKEVRRESKLTVAYIRGVEKTEIIHSHAAIIAAQPIDNESLQRAWQTVSRTGPTGCLATTFDASQGGIGYILKDGEYEIAHNIQCFSSRTDPGTLSCRELRTYNRVQEQKRAERPQAA